MSADSKVPEEGSPMKFTPTTMMNMRLLGNKQSSLEASMVGGTGKIRLNIGKLSKDKVVGNIGVEVTQEGTTINDRKILIPSFSTTSTIFNQHFIILKDLKKRIEGLRKAYVRQREEDRAWELVDKIIVILDTGCKYLDFVPS
jgi:hypothetical protein